MLARSLLNDRSYVLQVHHVFQRPSRPSAGPAFRLDGPTGRCEWDRIEKITFSVLVPSPAAAAEHTIFAATMAKELALFILPPFVDLSRALFFMSGV
jgi:hypothetical protein